jgi:hypothetical protein
LGEAEQALGLLHKAAATGRGENYAIPNLVHCLVALDRVDEAKEVVRKVLDNNPDFTLANLRIRLTPFGDRDFREQRLASFRVAGVPDG